jgi:hypothetical protein
MNAQFQIEWRKVWVFVGILLSANPVVNCISLLGTDQVHIMWKF